MDMLPQKFNINTALPQNQISEKAESNKYKSSHKLNVSDYFVNKKKVMKKLSQKFTDLIIFDNKKVTIIKRNIQEDHHLLLDLK